MNTVSPLARHDDPCLDEADGTPRAGSPSTRLWAGVDRLVAQARYESLAATGRIGPDDAYCRTHIDEDLCGVEHVDKPMLYMQKKGEVDPVSSTDVNQGMLGDCYLLACLAALASTPAGRDHIRGAIQENMAPNGKVGSYTVTLHKPEIHAGKPTTFSEVHLTVDALLGEKHVSLRASDRGTELWPAVMEKAYAQFSGGYRALQGGSPARAMEVLTGKPASTFLLGPTSDYSARCLQADLAAGKLVILCSKRNLDPSGPITSRHAYQITGGAMSNGRFVVSLHNPWNTGDPAVIPFDDLARSFQAVDVGSVR